MYRFKGITTCFVIARLKVVLIYVLFTSFQLAQTILSVFILPASVYMWSTEQMSTLMLEAVITSATLAPLILIAFG